MKHTRLLLPVLLVVAAVSIRAGDATTPTLGIHHKTPTRRAFTHATIVVSPDRTLTDATMLVEDGVIRQVGSGVKIPAGTVEIDLSGKTVYAAFIDPFSDYGLPEPERGGRRFGRAPKYEASRVGGSAWNEAIHAEQNWADSFRPDSVKADPLLHQGFGAVQTARLDGIFRGRSAVVLLNDGLPNDQIVRPLSLPFLSFSKGSSTQDYPSSLMGSIAILRQMFLDVDWYRRARAAWQANPAQPMPEFNAAIEALEGAGKTPMLFDSDSELDLLRAHKIAAEFGLTFVYVGSNREYDRIDQVEPFHPTLVLPVNFPDPPEVKTIEDELDVSLAKLRQWERAPYNPGVVAAHHLTFAFTARGLKNTDDFLKNVRLAVKRGLPAATALRALTTVPAEICGVSKELGTLEIGKLASFVITDGSLFDDTTQVMEVWIAGHRHNFAPLNPVDFRGTYELAGLPGVATLKLSGKLSKPSGRLMTASDTVSLSEAAVDDEKLVFAATLKQIEPAGVFRFTARLMGDTLRGQAGLPDGSRIEWTGTLVSAYAPEADTTAPKQSPPDTLLSAVTRPNRAFGTTGIPPIQNVLFRHATVWTSAADGVLEDADVLIRDGKIAAVGQGLAAPDGFTVIDATGKHITPGIIDEHSHIAIDGDVNEGTHAVTPEVRIPDVVNPDDLSIYRQLAGGVTAARILHGSANPIGGEVCVIKHRWGCASPDDMILKTAPRAVKFALGENVKQSNWGPQFTTRYPQTRLGVESIIRDAFLAARDYQAEWAAYDKLSGKQQQTTVPPRKDLQLEALSDILNSKLHITSHGYVANEMLMLIRLADEFGIKIQSFAHGLEAYKIADEVAAHGAGIGSFSDWWAYKFEVYDAIPQSPGLMTERGVTVAVNSDNADLARRLNQEAAKSVLYTGMEPQEALKMVTINPAKILGIDDRTGSLETGKDADLVVWSGPPLSIYSRAEQTWVDGREYFSLEADSLMRQSIEAEKQALIQKALSAGSDDGPPRGGGRGRGRWRPGTDNTARLNNDLTAEGGRR